MILSITSSCRFLGVRVLSPFFPFSSCRINCTVLSLAITLPLAVIIFWKLLQFLQNQLSPIIIDNLTVYCVEGSLEISVSYGPVAGSMYLLRHPLILDRNRSY